MDISIARFVRLVLLVEYAALHVHRFHCLYRFLKLSVFARAVYLVFSHSLICVAGQYLTGLFEVLALASSGQGLRHHSLLNGPNLVIVSRQAFVICDVVVGGRRAHFGIVIVGLVHSFVWLPHSETNRRDY